MCWSVDAGHSSVVSGGGVDGGFDDRGDHNSGLSCVSASTVLADETALEFCFPIRGEPHSFAKS